MPYRICKSIDVENGHMLSKHPDKCQFPHGHTRKVEIVIESSELDENQMVCDFKIIKVALEDWLDRFDHALCMNTDDPAYTDFKARYGDRVIGFEHQDPTTELMSKTIFDHAVQALADYAGSPGTRCARKYASPPSGSGKPPHPRRNILNHVVRNAAALLKADVRVASFSVRAVNHESIHDHNAFAVVVSGKASDQADPP